MGVGLGMRAFTSGGAHYSDEQKIEENPQNGTRQERETGISDRAIYIYRKSRYDPTQNGWAASGYNRR